MPKDERIHVRCEAWERKHLERGAEAAGESLSRFLVEAGIRRATALQDDGEPQRQEA